MVTRGQWTVKYLYHNFQRHDENCNQFPITCKVLDSLGPQILRGMVCFSSLKPGTHDDAIFCTRIDDVIFANRNSYYAALWAFQYAAYVSSWNFWLPRYARDFEFPALSVKTKK